MVGTSDILRKQDGLPDRDRLFSPLLILLLLCLNISIPTAAISQSSSTGIIQGTVVDDETEEPLVAVNVMLEGTPYGTMTNAEGFYLLRNVPAGEHTLLFSYIGYRGVRMEKVDVLPSLRTTVDVRMEQTTLEMPPVVVTAERPLIQRDITGTMHKVASVEIQSLPVDTFQEIVELQPGVVYGGHIRGGRPGETLYVMDGIPIQDPTSGTSAVGLPKSAITELNIHTGGFDAEYGNALSGVVHIVTRRGSNHFEGMARYGRDDLGSLFNWTEHSGYSQFETMLSGPIRQDRSFYFLSTDFMSEDTRWWQDFEHTSLEGPYHRAWNIFARTDFYLSQALRISGQGLFSHQWENDYEWRWRFNLEGLPSNWRNSGRVAFTLNQMISPSIFYDLQLSHFIISKGVNEGDKASLEDRPLWTYDNFLQYVEDGERLWWFRGTQNITTGKGSITAQVERHRLKAGFESALYGLSSNLLKIEPRTTFYGMPIAEAEPLDFSHNYHYWPRTGALFLQDTYESADGLILKIGFRYDWLNPRAERPVIEWVPVTSEDFQQGISDWVPATRKAQFSPRIGLSFPISMNTYFLVNFGQFFQVPLFDHMYSGLNVDITRGLRVLVGNPDLEHMRTKAYEMSVRSQLDPESAGSITCFFKESFNLVDTKTYLAPDSRALEDGFTQYVNLPLAQTSGVELAYEKRPAEGLGTKLAYTYMVAKGQGETELSNFNYFQWGFLPDRRMYYLSWDQRHTITLEILGEIAGFDVDIVGRYNSPRPYTRVSRDSEILPEEAEVIPNNARMREIIQMDARVRKSWSVVRGGREFELVAFCDVRNLTDHKNVVWIAGDGRIGGELGDPGAYRIGRRTRIGLEVWF